MGWLIFYERRFREWKHMQTRLRWYILSDEFQWESIITITYYLNRVSLGHSVSPGSLASAIKWERTVLSHPEEWDVSLLNNKF